MAEWITGHLVELFGVVFSFLYLYLSIRQHIWLWPVGIASAIMYVIVFFESGFYADMSLNVYYLVISMYGWTQWNRRGDDATARLRASHVNRPTVYLSGLIFVVLLISIALILKNFTDSTLPWGDSFTTAGSIIATWMLARKKIEHWLIWIVVDLVSMGLYIYKGLYPTAALFLVYTVMAVIGYIQWKKEISRKVR